MTTRAEVLAAIRAAKQAVDAYNGEGLRKSLTEGQRVEIDSIDSLAKSLVESMHRSYMLGPAGGVCTACKGTGRA